MFGFIEERDGTEPYHSRQGGGTATHLFLNHREITQEKKAHLIKKLVEKLK